jgi:hypothetical protein
VGPPQRLPRTILALAGWLLVPGRPLAACYLQFN